jgi:hypothetical protein
MSSWREIMGAPARTVIANHTQYPQNSTPSPSRLSSEDFEYETGTSDLAPIDAAAARAKQISQAAEAAHMDLVDYATMIGAVELVFVEPREKVTPVSPDFPPCPACGTSRFWISNLGKVVCSVCGETRFILASISYHPVN